MPDHASDPPRACPGIERLDAIAAGAPSGSDSLHVASCEHCRSLIAEMREANQFLQRLRTGAPRTIPEPPAQNIEIPGYEIHAVASVGGQGIVFRAVQLRTGKVVAIKVPHADSMSRPSARFRFQREIELTARLDHPGIVRVLGACELNDSRLGCVMEFVEGQTFDRWAEITRAQEGGTRLIVRAAERVADAIAYAHQRAVMHRDIKPSNVLVTRDGVPRTLDFGLAKALDDSGAMFTTLTGAFVGTLAFAAPEQITSGADAADLRTDVYGIGLLLYQGLTGRLPHAHDAPTSELLRQIREIDPPRPSSLVPAIGTELDAILLKALAKSKERRYASAAELRDDLRAWLDGRAVRARFDSRWYVMRKFVRRHRVLAASAVAALIVGATITTLALIAREQATRARIADAVGSARVLDSHWARMSEARAIAADNFEPGERLAWDALLDPDPALIDNAIESLVASAPKRTSPAYWALWEIYLRTPIRFTIPTAARTQVLYDAARDQIAAIPDNPLRVEWWDWQTASLAHSLDLPFRGQINGFAMVPASGAIVMSSKQLPPYVIAPDRATILPLEGGKPASGIVVSQDLFASTINSPAGGTEIVVWKGSPPSVILRLPEHAPPDAEDAPSTSGPVASIAIDSSGRFLAIVHHRSDLTILRLPDGSTALHRNADQLPRFTKVLSRGNAGEFILHGPERIAVINVERDPLNDLRNAIHKSGFIEGVRTIAHASNAERYAIVSDRWRLGVARKSDPVTTGSYLPSLSTWAPTLSDDGRYAAIQMRQSGRASVLDLDSPAVRRLPFDSEVTQTGFATIFALRFSSDSRTLFAASMDGTLRAFSTDPHTINHPPASITPSPIEGGITSLIPSPTGFYLGTHDIGLGSARILHADSTAVTTVLPDAGQWICGLELEPERALWALTGDGRLLTIDPRSARVTQQTKLEPSPAALPRTLLRIPRLALLIAGPSGPGVAILDQNTLQPLAPPVPMPPLRRIIASPADPDLLASAHDDGTIRLWKLRASPTISLELAGTLGTHAGAIFSLAFSPDGSLLASGGGTPEQRDLRIWSVAHQRELASLNLLEAGVFDVAFSPDARWLAVAGEIRLDAPREGGQLFLIDLHAPDQCIAANLEYHIARFTAEHARTPRHAAPLRAWAASLRNSSPRRRRHAPRAQ